MWKSQTVNQKRSFLRNGAPNRGAPTIIRNKNRSEPARECLLQGRKTLLLRNWSSIQNEYDRFSTFSPSFRCSNSQDFERAVSLDGWAVRDRTAFFPTWWRYQRPHVKALFEGLIRTQRQMRKWNHPLHLCAKREIVRCASSDEAKRKEATRRY